jgi:hypothetical protein
MQNLEKSVTVARKEALLGTQFTCFTSTKVPQLTKEEALPGSKGISKFEDSSISAGTVASAPYFARS